MERNPLIEPENFFEGYNKSIEGLKNNPEILEFDKMCYMLFEHSPEGKRFIEYIIKRYLIPSLVAKGNTYQIDILWQEGFKDFVRMLINCVSSHKQRINAGNQNVR